MLAVLGAATLVLVAGAPWVLRAAAGEPWGLAGEGELRASGPRPLAGRALARVPNALLRGAVAGVASPGLNLEVAGGWETKQRQKCASPA